MPDPDLAKPIRDIGSIYGKRLESLQKAITGTGDAPNMDPKAIRTALQLPAQGSDPHIDASYDRVFGGAKLGSLMLDGKTPLVPWSAFLDSESLEPLGPEFWHAIGIDSAGKMTPFNNIKNVPKQVSTSSNITNLRKLAADAETRNVASSQVLLRQVNQIFSISTVSPAGAGATGATTSDTGTSSQALKIDDVIPGIQCLAQASFHMVPSVFPCVLEICINRACADQLESLLSFGVSDLLSKGLPALQKIFTNGASAIVAGVQSLGGWVAFCIAVSCAYWAALIHLNKTPKGICLYIPLPWTFGLIGPGWAIGTK